MPYSRLGGAKGVVAAAVHPRGMDGPAPRSVHPRGADGPAPRSVRWSLLVYRPRHAAPLAVGLGLAGDRLGVCPVARPSATASSPGRVVNHIIATTI